MAMLPFAALSLGAVRSQLQQLSVEKLVTAWKSFLDSGNYAMILPPVGSQQLSYAKFLQLLSHRKIKRIILMDNATCAIVEGVKDMLNMVGSRMAWRRKLFHVQVPVEGYAASYKVPLTSDRMDPSIKYAGAATPEAEMEKIRYYVELPGDLYEDGYFMNLVKVNQGDLRDENGRILHHDLLRSDQTYLELQVVDPSEANQFLDSFGGQLYPIIAIVGLSFFIGLGSWLMRFFGTGKVGKEEMVDEYSKFKGTLYNVEGGSKGTGVRYEDVAGVEHAMDVIKNTVEILVGGEEYRAMGAKPARGILMEGPPGTGKTFLAKAMAGESGLPFISTNGSEFVEMFEGVAASRVRDLFKVARRLAPCIIFIDEIDAIGKARGEGDDISSERESGLMQILYEMDGFSRDDRVLVVGATNRKDALDDALLRPGRFDRTIHMGLPGAEQRFKILQVHARDKPVPRGGDEQWSEDALLHRTAELTIDYSGAALANLLNEAAILMVRKQEREISLQLVNEVMDKKVLGSAGPRLPDTQAKRHLALSAAAKAVVIALTPGMPPLQRMTILPRGQSMARTLFTPQNHNTLYQLGQPGSINAVHLEEPLSAYEMMSALLVPMFAARSAEEAFYGPKGVTLSTSKEISSAGSLARELVRSSTLFPAYRRVAVSYDMVLGGGPDPTVQMFDAVHERFVEQLLRAAHTKALRIVKERQPAIRAVAEKMCSSENDTIFGTEIVEVIQSSPIADTLQAGAAGASSFSSSLGRAGRSSFRPPNSTPATGEADLPKTPSGGVATATFSGAGVGRGGVASFRGVAQLGPLKYEDVVTAIEVMVGQPMLADITAVGLSDERIAEVMAQLEVQDLRERLKAVKKFSVSNEISAEFPPPPPVPEYRGPALAHWVEAGAGVAELEALEV